MDWTTMARDLRDTFHQGGPVVSTQVEAAKNRVVKRAGLALVNQLFSKGASPAPPVEMRIGEAESGAALPDVPQVLNGTPVTESVSSGKGRPLHHWHVCRDEALTASQVHADKRVMSHTYTFAQPSGGEAQQAFERRQPNEFGKPPHGSQIRVTAGFFRMDCRTESTPQQW